MNQCLDLFRSAEIRGTTTIQVQIMGPFYHFKASLLLFTSDLFMVYLVFYLTDWLIFLALGLISTVCCLWHIMCTDETRHTSFVSGCPAVLKSGLIIVLILWKCDLISPCCSMYSHNVPLPLILSGDKAVLTGTTWTTIKTFQTGIVFAVRKKIVKLSSKKMWLSFHYIKVFKAYLHPTPWF